MIAIYVIKRIIYLIPTLLLVSFIIFAMVRLIPGDPAQAVAGEFATPEAIAAVRTSLGLDRPLLTQYLQYLTDLLHGNLGTSFQTHQSVWNNIWDRFLATAELAGAGILVSLVVGTSLGVVAALRPGSWMDSFARLISLFGVSSPTFWTGLLFVLAFGYYLRLFPIAGKGGIDHLILPAVTVATTSIAFISRLTRSSLLEALSSDYVRTARAKGVNPIIVVIKHALRNALIAPITVAGLELGRLLSGVIVIEVIFAWPGTGRLLIDSIQLRDFPVIQGLILFYAIIFALVNVCVDVAYALLDPRVVLH